MLNRRHLFVELNPCFSRSSHGLSRDLQRLPRDSAVFVRALSFARLGQLWPILITRRRVSIDRLSLYPKAEASTPRYLNSLPSIGSNVILVLRRPSKSRRTDGSHETPAPSLSTSRARLTPVTHGFRPEIRYDSRNHPPRIRLRSVITFADVAHDPPTRETRKSR